MDDAIARPASCATATVAAALRAVGDLDGRTVLVQGAGMLGLTACAMARAGGAAEVLCCDVEPLRLRHAEAFGATRTAAPGELAAVVSAASGGHGVDVALEMSGAAAAFESGLALLRMGGTFVLVGAVFPGEAVPVVVEQIVRRVLTLHGVHNYVPEDLRRAVEFLSKAHRYPFAGLVADWFPLADVEEAFRKVRAPGVFRVGVRP
jgi:alcohol dehydrogenase